MYSSRVSSLAANRTQKSLSSSKRGSALLNLSRRGSANTSLNRSLQSSHIFEETGSHVVEGFGAPLPVLVTEILTSERNTIASVKLSENGWAWLVSGRRLFMWKYKSNNASKTNTSHCRELTLPSSDLAHKADLVSVLDKEGSTMTQPAAIAVSPEGLVRYWPSIAHEGSYLETSAELHGQECFSVTDIQPLGCILATTTSSLILLTTKNVSGQNNVQCHNLRPPQGMLAGISRRFSSFIFGSIPSQATESKLARVLVAEGNELYEKTLYVLFGPNLQKWYLIDQEPEQSIYDCNVDRMVRENFLAAIWDQDVGHLSEIKTWMIDMQLTRNGVVILVAAMKTGVYQRVHFALGHLSTAGDVPPANFSQFDVINYSEIYKDNEDLIQKFSLVYPSVTSPIMYIYTNNLIICTSGAEEPDKIEFRSQSDRILGSGCYDKSPLFFINSKGIVSLMPSHQFGVDVSMSLNESTRFEPSELDVSVALNISSVPKSDDLADDEDKTSKLKSALIHFIKKELKQCEELIYEHFPYSGMESENDSVLDVTVYRLSLNMIDDFPASDPRWAESYCQDTSSSAGSLIILHHLEGKQKACEYFTLFLKGTGLMDRFHSVTVGNAVVDTRHLLQEHAEKLVAAITLRGLHSSASGALDAAIKNILDGRGISTNGKLTAQDHFYRQVSGIDSIVPAMIENEMQVLASDIPIQEMISVVSTVNKVLQEMLQSVLKFRQSRAGDDSFLPCKKSHDEQPISWTNSEGSQGMRYLLVKQYMVTVEYAVKNSDDVQTKGLLFQQMVDLADIILGGYTSQLEAIKDFPAIHNQLSERYTKDRYRLILPLLEVNQPERAAALAEKYCDFKILVQLCEESDNQERLQRYMAQFAKDGFTDFVFKWYLDEGKRGKLLKQSFLHSRDLAKFLSIHPTLSWVHHLQTSDFDGAQKTLHQLADNETEFLSRKKTMLSLSKLSSLVSEAPEQTKESIFEDINQRQDLILHQETLPGVVLESLGMTAEDMRVLSPQELIKMYVSDENTSANEYDFKKALDLLQYVKPNPYGDGDEEDEDDPSNLHLHIFCKAILRDSWMDLDTDAPLETLKSTIFFRIVNLAFKSGVDLNEFLPAMDALLDRPELAELAEDSTFRFLVQAGYEHIAQFIV